MAAEKFDDLNALQERISAAWDRMQNTDIRLELGEAWMMCSDCGGKLFSFDGHQDAERRCPYMRHGKCDPK